MDKKNTIIILLVIALIVMAGFMTYPNIKEKITTPYLQQGYQICQLQIIQQIVNDLNNQGYTTLTIENQSIKLGVLK